MKATQTTKEESKGSPLITIPPIKRKLAKITIIGTSPLLVNKFSEKAKKELDVKHQKKAKGAREARDPLAEFEAAKYRLPNGRYGIPASGIKKCAIRACSFIEGVPMTKAKGMFFVMEDGDGLVEIKSKEEPVMDERFVRVGKFGNKQPMNRYRPRFDEWECTFRIDYDSDLISPEQLANLFERAGFSVGLCEYRPEKDGNLGMFRIKTT